MVGFFPYTDGNRCEREKVEQLVECISFKLYGLLNFLGITGMVRIDDNGDRDADYSLLDLDPVTGRFEVVSHYYGSNR